MKAIALRSGSFCLFLCLFISGLPARAWPFEEPLSPEAPRYDNSNGKTAVSIEKDVVEKVRAGTCWRRIYFTVSGLSNLRQPAVLLGRVGDADEVYLNGVKIGGEGKTGEGFVIAAKVERLYRLPQNLLKSAGENLLAVRVMNLYPGGRLFESPVTFGDYGDLLVLKLKLHYTTKNVEFILFTFLFIWIEFCLFLYVKGVTSKEYIAFGIFMLLYSAAYFLNSLTFYETGLKNFFIQKLIISLYAALPAAMLYFIVCVFHEKPRTALRSNIAFSLLLSAAALLVEGEEARIIIVYFWTLSCVSSGLTALVLAINAYRRKLFESGPLLAGVVWLCLAGGYSLISRTTGLLPQFNVCSHYLPDFILLIWIISVKYGLIVRYVRIKHGMQALSGSLLSAHEEERKRLARDLHDSMGQNLAAVKFNLQRINREMKSELIDGVIEEVSGSIKELRDITAGLMPVSLRAMGVKRTIEFYCEKFSEKTGIKVSVNAEDVPRLSEGMELTLFRVFQEAVNNAAKHSGADSIGIRLSQDSPRLIMEITDNGRGFDYPQAQSRKSGMGLSIMEERMRLMGGDFTVASVRDKGTTIRVEAPVK